MSRTSKAIRDEDARDQLVARLRELYASDFEAYASDNLYIRTKSGEIKPFVLNRAQKYLHARLEEQLRARGWVRAIGLKGRQQGFSTYTQGRYRWRVTHHSGVRAFILTHEEEATNNLFEIAQRFQNLAPDDFRMATGAANAKELHFPKLDSGYRVGTAGNKAAGRSSTIQYFHGSEVAYWPNADAHKSGVMQALPMLPGTEAILESTANGVGGMFHEMWKDAEKGVGEYIAVFIPWFWQEEYRIAPPAGFKRTASEQRIAARFELDDRQLAWRRAKIAEIKPTDVKHAVSRNPEDLFKQEYPNTPEEAFLFSGQLVFNPDHMLRARDNCWEPRYCAELRELGLVDKRSDGRLKVWSDPKPGKRYVIGADVAEGIAQGDYSSCDVLDVDTGKQVAAWHGHEDPDKYGLILGWLGKRYNFALVGVERNNHGLTTLTALRNMGYRRMYAQQDLEHRSDRKETKKMGWLTTEKSKAKIIDQLAAELRDEEHGIHDEATIDEMGTYIIDEDRKMTAKPGCFDDRVMSRAIAGEMRRVALIPSVAARLWGRDTLGSGPAAHATPPEVPEGGY